LLVMLACGCGSAVGAPVAGVAPVYVSEEGPLLVGESQMVSPLTGAHRGWLPAYRVESFGATVLDLSLWGPGATLWVEGPLVGADGDGGFQGSPLARAGDRFGGGAHLAGVRLKVPGVYRVVAAGTGVLTLESRCTSGTGCFRPVMTWVELIDRMSRDGMSAMLDLREMPLPGLTATDPAGRLRFAVGLAESLGRDPHLLPRLRLDSLLSYLYFGTVDQAQELPRERLREAVDIQQELARCDEPRRHPVPILYGYSVGHFPDLSLSRCQVTHSERLARILTELCRREYGSAPLHVGYRGRTYIALSDLVGALVDAGHRVEMRDVRSLTESVNVTVAGKETFWPVWLKTGISLEHGRTLEMPASRSRMEWRITGPDVNARVALEVVKAGATFLPAVYQAPGWVGRHAVRTTTNPSDVVESFRVAAQYVRVTRPPVGKGQAEAWGGTSSDASALLTRAVWGEPEDGALPFPLLRPASSAAALERLARPGIDVATVSEMSRLPHDVEAAELPAWKDDRLANRDAVARAYRMMPMSVDDPRFDWFPAELRRDVCLLGHRVRADRQGACDLIVGGSRSPE
jgi:hypothetical protein